MYKNIFICLVLVINSVTYCKVDAGLKYIPSSSYIRFKCRKLHHEIEYSDPYSHSHTVSCSHIIRFLIAASPPSVKAAKIKEIEEELKNIEIQLEALSLHNSNELENAKKKIEKDSLLTKQSLLLKEKQLYSPDFDPDFYKTRSPYKKGDTWYDENDKPIQISSREEERYKKNNLNKKILQQSIQTLLIEKSDHTRKKEIDYLDKAFKNAENDKKQYDYNIFVWILRYLRFGA